MGGEGEFVMGYLQNFVDIILHLDKYLVQFVADYGLFTYVVLFSIIFAETGFVVTPFLPGDSLLFAAGAIAAIGSLHVWVVGLALAVAAILGDTVNYWLGHFLGQKVVDNPKVPFINQEHIDRTQKFYAKYGGKTIILARFVPIVRTFAPFVAGVGKMDYSKFFLFNVIGGIAWVFLFTFAGYFFGNIPFVQKNFHYVIIAIIFLSLVPMGFEYIQSKRHSARIDNVHANSE